MGMYTELNISAVFEKDCEILPVLRYMVGQEVEDVIVPKHNLFNSGRWEFMLRCDSFYFDHTANSELVDRFDVDYVLNVRCDLKNYSDEIEDFLDWIRPYTRTRGFIGYKRYEEDANPTLIYLTDEGVEYKKVER